MIRWAEKIEKFKRGKLLMKTMTISDAREFLKEMCAFEFKNKYFENYIDNTLSGDFAVEIVKIICKQEPYRSGLKDSEGKELNRGSLVEVYHRELKETVRYKVIFESGCFKGVRFPDRMAEDAHIGWLALFGKVVR